MATETNETAIATVEEILGRPHQNGRGGDYMYVSAEEYYRLQRAFESLGFGMVPEGGTVSFCHGKYTAPWSADQVRGKGYDLTFSWSRNAATGADNGHRIGGSCPQWQAQKIQRALACVGRLAPDPGREYSNVPEINRNASASASARYRRAVETAQNLIEGVASASASEEVKALAAVALEELKAR